MFWLAEPCFCIYRSHLPFSGNQDKPTCSFTSREPLSYYILNIGSVLQAKSASIQDKPFRNHPSAHLSRSFHVRTGITIRHHRWPVLVRGRGEGWALTSVEPARSKENQTGFLHLAGGFHCTRSRSSHQKPGRYQSSQRDVRSSERFYFDGKFGAGQAAGEFSVLMKRCLFKVPMGWLKYLILPKFSGVLTLISDPLPISLITCVKKI